MLKSTLITTLSLAAACNLSKGNPIMPEDPHPQLKHTEVQPALFGDDHMSEGVLLPLSDGRIMLAFRRDPGTEGHHVGTGGHIAQSIYDPAADRWSPIKTIYSSNGRFDDRNIHGGVTRDGRLVLFMRRMRGNKQTEKRYVLSSDDDGRTWSELQESKAWSDPETSGIPGIWSTGQMFYNPDIEQYMMVGCRRYATFSPNGVTWEKVVKMTDSEQYKLTEVAAAWCGENRVVALIRDNEHKRGRTLLQLVSRDNGETWTDPEPSNIPPDNHWGCAPQVIYDAERNLLIALNSTRYTVPNNEQALYIYTARPDEIMDGPKGWTRQLELPRPWADDAMRDKRPLNHTFYGYPTIAPISDNEYLVVFTERAHMHGTEQADLYYFRLQVNNATNIGTRRELFVDRALVDGIDGDAELHLHKPEPREVVLVTDEPWEGNISAYFTVFRDDDLYRMYYRGSHYDEAAKDVTHEVVCYAESDDGVNWRKPDLGLVEFEGSTENNIVLGPNAAHCFTPFKDANPDAKPEAQYKALSRDGMHGLHAFQSADGIHWERMAEDHVITEGGNSRRWQFDSQNLAFWDAENKVYREYHRAGRKGKRDIMTSTSTDFLNWTEPVFLEYPDAPAEHLYTNAVLPYPRAPHILLGFPTRYHPKRKHQVEPTLMAGRDGRTFHRRLDPLIPVTAPKDRDGNRSNYMAWGLVQLPDKEREYSVYATEAYYKGPDSRLRRFAYRADGFVSLRGGPEGGSLLTEPVQFRGNALEINYATEAQGQVSVELQHADGTPIKGFTLADCKPLSGDDIEGRVRWNSERNLSELKNTPVRIRFEVKNGDLFSYRFHNPAPPQQPKSK